MDFVGMLKAGFEAFTKVFDWKTGGRTREENALRKEANKWTEDYKQAMAVGDVDRANHALAELRRVQRESRAKAT